MWFFKKKQNKQISSKTLILTRHVSGAGSSTLAQNIADLCDAAEITCTVASADQYFEDKDGGYHFNVTALSLAHQFCLDKVRAAMFTEDQYVICTNTFTTEGEIKPYIDLAQKYNYKVLSLIVERRHDGQNIHNVPEETRQKQERRLRNSIKLL